MRLVQLWERRQVPDLGLLARLDAHLGLHRRRPVYHPSFVFLRSLPSSLKADLI